MRLTSFLLLVLCMHVSAKVASQRITFSGKEVPLEKVFSAIKKQAGFVVMYNKSLLKNRPPVTIDARDMPLPAFLDEVLKNQPLKYRISVQTIFLSEKPVEAITAPQQPRELKVSGIVFTNDREPLPGASVRLRGLTTGASTNANGMFTLERVSENAVLQVSSLGFKSREISLSRLLNGSAVAGVKTLTNEPAAISFEVVMEQLTDSLEAVVINSYATGYQTLSKERATGAFATVTAGVLQQQRLSNLNSLLEGRVAGYNNGLIRGTTSMNGVTSPLYVVDGLPVENTSLNSFGDITEALPGLNLEDIEKITVLKDAAAASIYGARAANGVIVIVTKKAKKGRPQVNASSTFTFQPYNFYTGNRANAADLVELEKEWAAGNPGLQGPDAASYAQSMLDNKAYINQGANAYFDFYAGNITQQQLDAKLASLAAGGYNYYDDMARYAKRNTFLQQHNVSIASAGEKNAFYASATYRDDALEDRYASDRNLGINIRNTAHLTKWLDLEVGTYLLAGDSREQAFNALSPGYTVMPYDRLVNADGSHFTSLASSRLSVNDLSIIDQYGLYSANVTPLDEISRNIGHNKSFNSRSVARLEVRFADWISYQSSFQYENNNQRFSRLYDKNSYYVRNRVNSFAGYTAAEGFFYKLPYGHIYNRNSRQSSAYTFRQQLNIDRSFGKHNLTAIFGSETRHAKLEFNEQTQYNYDPDVLSYDLVNAADLARAQGLFFNGSFSARDLGYDQETINRFVSFYGNAGYSYDDKYLVSGSLRWDRSNLWGTDARYQRKPLWSVGLGWNIYRENFFTPGFVSFLKLRGSYGLGGNIAKNSAPYMTAFYYSNNQLGGLEGSIASRPNPLLSWERTFTGNVGVDFAMYNNRITGSVDYYNKKGKDLLANTMGVPTEGFGFATYQINNGEMTNHGVEVTVSADIIKSKDWNWNVTGLFAFNRNKVTHVKVEAPMYIYQMDYPEAYPRVGNPFNAIYSYEWAGLNEEGLPQVYDETKNKALVSPPNLAAVKYSGTTVPIYSGSFNSALSYKGLTLAFLLTYEGGHKMRNSNLPMLNNEYNYNVFSYMTQFGSVHKRITDRWREPGDELRTNVPKALFAEDPDFNSDTYTLYANSSINVLNARNIRLSNISLAWNVPQAIIAKAFMQSARLQFNVENLFTLAADKDAKFLMGGYRRPNYVWGLYLGF
ncbi:SusC/RagA family TonB-linked outer membrane protein [Chitinophaga horti]|uniref:SusC/RagA family TonB-linked outer membrane protein n=1 Tax=Chitinophaga horti TaxID=2920382 RepID=A0ABY6J8U2_9BACT|nr:SusC/RagA family TonB-linked outer membrane protein [Chitinophaga horti]UYQ95746.1 SusC/RagA family TonB-linked outer membrane protein [Chitinophaga horti]